MTVEEKINENRIYAEVAFFAIEEAGSLGFLHGLTDRPKQDPYDLLDLTGDWEEDTIAEIRLAYLREYKEGKELR